MEGKEMMPKFRIFDKKKKRFLGDFTMEIW